MSQIQSLHKRTHSLTEQISLFKQEFTETVYTFSVSSSYTLSNLPRLPEFIIQLTELNNDSETMNSSK
jgi:hypothetical protein